ncbi:MAG: citrate (Si)-synthase, partial [Pseudomonadota bacterium]
MENKVKPNGTATFSVAGKTAEFPVYSGTHGPDVVDIGTLNKQAGVFTLDPGFTSTGS